MKIFKIFLTVFVFQSFIMSAFSANTTLDGKIGAGYATDPAKFGWQLNFSYLNELDPFFALGFEPGIYWINWDRKVGTQIQGSTVQADVKADTNAYVMPLLVDAQIRLPNLEQKLSVKPYITIGLGYSIMLFNYSQPEYTSTSGITIPSESESKYFHGLTWQIMTGITFDPGPTSKIEFLFEAGFRGAKLKKGDLEVDMSGFIINAGIRYPFGGASSANAI